MPTLHAIILGIVQGLSEFLPISSSGHLLLVPDLLGWNDFGGNDSLEKSFDVALHLGTLIAALWYFRHDLLVYLRAALHSIRVRAVDTTDARLAWLLLLSAIPGAIAGAAFESTIEDHLGDPILIGVNSIVFALLLLWADQAASKLEVDDFHTREATVMGFAQALALAPGVSRSGVTITAGRWLRFDRESATRTLVPDEHPDHRRRDPLQGRSSSPVTGSRAASAARSSGEWSRPGSAASSRSCSC